MLLYLTCITRLHLPQKELQFSQLNKTTPSLGSISLHGKYLWTQEQLFQSLIPSQHQKQGCSLWWKIVALPHSKIIVLINSFKGFDSNLYFVIQPTVWIFIFSRSEEIERKKPQVLKKTPKPPNPEHLYRLMLGRQKLPH